ncbi:hypothetical protein [Bradyrhizobium sp. 2TAF24]|uniref:hypothetical protein n=1 Tax=Bradyrhizobium sp. 2TAF24 TaxID=3233011 RepID=UPI003F906EB6
MTDCTKEISDLTPYETYRCFVEADIWKAIGANAQRMWSDFSGTTNGEWGQVIIAFAFLPAQAASYAFPIMFLYRLVQRVASPARGAPGPKERRLKIGWAIYLICAGVILLIWNHQDRFMLFQGGLEIACGILISMLGASWWTSPRAYPADAGVGSA